MKINARREKMNISMNSWYLYMYFNPAGQIFFRTNLFNKVKSLGKLHFPWNLESSILWSVFPRWLSGEEPTYHVGDERDMGSIPGLGRFLGGGHGNPLQYSHLENPMDRGVWWAKVYGITKSQTWQYCDLSFSKLLSLCTVCLLKYIDLILYCYNSKIG